MHTKETTTDKVNQSSANQNQPTKHSATVQTKQGQAQPIQAKQRPIQAKQKPIPSKTTPIQAKQKPVQRQVNKKKAQGLPEKLQNNMEAMSGTDLSDVQVHYNSNKPAQLQAEAYAQGTDIHLSPGKEKHLGHEAWHVVQQKQGRVQPTVQAKNGTQINDDPALEKEADAMGDKAMNGQVSGNQVAQAKAMAGKPVAQANGRKRGQEEHEPLMADEDVNKYNVLGHQLVGTYRALDKITKFINKGQGREVFEKCIFAFFEAALSCTTAITGIPGLVVSEGGMYALKVTEEAVAQQGVKSALSAAEGIAKPGPVSIEPQPTTSVGVVKKMGNDKFGSPEKAAKSVVRLVPFVSAIETLKDGVITAWQGEDNFNRLKAKVIASVETTMRVIEEAMSGLDRELCEDIEIRTSNRKVFVRHTTRKLSEVITKYNTKANDLKIAIEEWRFEHGEAEHLLGEAPGIDLENA